MRVLATHRAGEVQHGRLGDVAGADLRMGREAERKNRAEP